MTTAVNACEYCGAPIVDPTTEVVQGQSYFCCRNCSHAMNQSGSGSDPQTPDYPNELRCQRCGCPLLDESTVEEEGDAVFCCGNCAAAARMGMGVAP
jgi:hypothetical protein